ncbi:gamma-glutamyl-gamma-aminobutyrate hydrolase [Desulfotomaculum arcticum]|uniref:Gamma-glutamyl-gamma-aminobutyrate hydrolase n=2 Tax=Desulfotruncus TaxID=2867377 RepID=A0A1I2WXC0_9FIRM|nr:gamma-glutamyl-gamma-aminobutyrate hydrolase [Desulfotomaculum arcticum] [Desulfotruncus arcticus DSM 17038]
MLVPGWSLIYTVRGCLEAVEKAGGVPLLLPVANNQSTRQEVLTSIDALIVSGEVLSVKRNVLKGGNPKDLSAQNPLRFANESAYILGALERNMPILGICRGLQVLNIVCGGSMFLDDIHHLPGRSNVQHHQGDKPPSETVHEVVFTPDTVLTELTGINKARVNSFHRQAVKEPPSDFRVIARADDGIIEGIAGTRRDFVVGVQFHPEVLPDPVWGKLFNGLIEAGKSYQKVNK